MLLGVELGDVSVSRQSDLQKLLGGYSFFDGTLGMVSLLVLIFLVNGWLGVYLTDEEGSILLVVLTIAVVAVLYEEVRLTCFVPPWHSGTIRFVRRVHRPYYTLYHRDSDVSVCMDHVCMPVFLSSSTLLGW